MRRHHGRASTQLFHMALPFWRGTMSALYGGAGRSDRRGVATLSVADILERLWTRQTLGRFRRGSAERFFNDECSFRAERSRETVCEQKSYKPGLVKFGFKELLGHRDPHLLGPPLRPDPQSYSALSDYLLTYSYSY